MGLPYKTLRTIASASIIIHIILFLLDDERAPSLEEDRAP